MVFAGQHRLNTKTLAWNRLLTLGTSSPDAQDFNSLMEAASTAVFTNAPYNKATANYCGLHRAIQLREAEVHGNYGRRDDRISGLGKNTRLEITMHSTILQEPVPCTHYW